MRWLAKKRVLLVVLAGFVLLLFLKSDWMGRMMYPISFVEEIQSGASDYEVDPYLIAAIIRVESNFHTGKVSKKGAAGVMQLMPDTAEWIIEMAKLEALTAEGVTSDTKLSIQAGSWYIHSLHQQFKGNSVAAVAAYNAGPGKVSKWLQNGTWDGTLKNLSSIPYGETRHYVQRVDYYYNKYKDLYPDMASASSASGRLS